MFLYHMTGYCKAEPVLTVSLSFQQLHCLFTPDPPFFPDFCGSEKNGGGGDGGVRIFVVFVLMFR